MPNHAAPPLETKEGVPTRRRGGPLEVAAVAAAVVAFIVGLWLVRGELGMTWDEPYFFERQHDICHWLARLAGTPGERAAAFDRQELERGWRFCREVPDQHPPVPSLLSLVSGVAPARRLRAPPAHPPGAPFLFFRAAGGPLPVVG